MVCPRCGHSVSVDAGRCSACGAAFAWMGVATDVMAADTRGGTGAISLQTPSQVATGPLKVGQTFGPRYHIIKLLGVGGMGAVYQAWDAELSVAVALKVIRVDSRHGTVSPEAEKRFKNE